MTFWNVHIFLHHSVTSAAAQKEAIAIHCSYIASLVNKLNEADTAIGKIIDGNKQLWLNKSYAGRYIEIKSILDIHKTTYS